MYGCVFYPFWVISFFVSFRVRPSLFVYIIESSLQVSLCLSVCGWCVYVCVSMFVSRLKTVCNIIYTHLTQCHLHILDDFHRCANSFDTQLTFTITESTQMQVFGTKMVRGKKVNIYVIILFDYAMESLFQLNEKCHTLFERCKIEVTIENLKKIFH